MPEIYNDSNGARVIVRHKGPAGRGFPSGGTAGQILAKGSANDYDAQWVNPPDGTDAVVGPASATNNNVAVFDGATGKLIKDGGQPLSNYASVSLVSTKQDAEAGKGLSQENFTTSLKNKLDGLSEHYRGTFASTAMLEGNVFSPAPVAGDYALIEVLGEAQTVSFWDDTNGEWDHTVVEQMTGQEIADALFDSADAAAWDKDTCRIFTESEKTQLAQHEAFISSLSGVSTETPFGALGYFSTVGSTIPITAVSDGLTNMVKVDVTTSMSAASLKFDNGGGVNGRLRYTGSAQRTFLVTAKVALDVTGADKLVFGLAKNNAVELLSRTIQEGIASGGTISVTLTSIIPLSLNDYLEVYIGNLTNTDDPLIHVLSIEASVL